MILTIKDQDIRSPEEIRLDEAERNVKGWRNLWFLKDGTVYNGNLLLVTETEANKLACDFLSEERKAMMPNADFQGIIVPKSLISYAIPMPIRGE